MPDYPAAHPIFLARYAELLGGEAPQATTHKSGSIGEAIAAFRSSDEFKTRAQATQDTWRRILAKIEDEKGIGLIRDLQPIHIRKDISALSPHPANNRLKVWRALCSWCYDKGRIDVDPASGVKKVKAPVTGGHMPWTRDDVAAFRKRWPQDSLERLAFELMHWTTCAVVDACRLAPGMIDGDGWLSYERQKTGTPAACTFYADPPDWAESNAHLLATIAAQPSKHMTFIVTSRGKPRSKKGASQWFAKACREAGLIDKTAHGIRKHRAAIFKENGASDARRKAWMGHESDEEATAYSRSADLKRIISGTESSNPPAELFQLSEKRPVK